jgi:hypothetical protein
MSCKLTPFPLIQAIIRENRWNLSKVIAILVRAYLAGNAQK